MIISFRIFGAIVFILAILWSAGLVGFAASLPRTVADKTSETDTVVVPTGGAGRLVAGLALLKAGMAERLFISGVHSQVTLSSIITRANAEIVACCVELGRRADDTYQNAEETAAWMTAHGYHSLRLVTGSYHMPRAILEFRHAMPDVRLVANPTFPQHVKVDDWWRYRGTAGLLASEYAKYLLALIRMPLSRASSQGSPP